jgi:hypothetical protein
VRTLFRSVDNDRPTGDEIRICRIDLALRNGRWTELEGTALVRRRRVLVHADSDEVFTLHRGVVFSPGSAEILFNEMAPMWFYVHDGELTFLKLEPGTWSDRVARRAQLEARRKAPPRPMRRGAA